MPAEQTLKYGWQETYFALGRGENRRATCFGHTFKDEASRRPLAFTPVSAPLASLTENRSTPDPKLRWRYGRQHKVGLSGLLGIEMETKLPRWHRAAACRVISAVSKSFAAALDQCMAGKSEKPVNRVKL